MRFVCSFLAFSCIAVSAARCGDPDHPDQRRNAVSPPAPCPAANNSNSAADGAYFGSVMDTLHSGLSSAFIATVRQVDCLFGEERVMEEVDESCLDLAVGMRYSRFDGGSFSHRTRAVIAVPQARRRLQITWHQLTEADIPENRGDLREAYENTTPKLGLRLRIFGDQAVRLTSGGGARLGSGPQVYGYLRGSVSREIDNQTELYIAQKLQYFTRDHWVAASDLRLSRALGDRWILQATPGLTWREEESGVEPGITFSAYRLSGRRKISRLDLGADWPETPHTREANYFVQAMQRWRIGRPWLFGELLVGVGFPQKEEFRPDPYVRLLVEVIAGNYR